MFVVCPGATLSSDYRRLHIACRCECGGEWLSLHISRAADCQYVKALPPSCKLELAPSVYVYVCFKSKVKKN